MRIVLQSKLAQAVVTGSYAAVCGAAIVTFGIIASNTVRIRQAALDQQFGAGFRRGFEAREIADILWNPPQKKSDLPTPSMVQEDSPPS